MRAYITGIINSVVTRYRRARDILKGVVTIREVERSGKLLGSIVGVSISGYEIEIFCTKKTFYRYCDGVIQTETEHSVYYVHSTVGEGAPDVLKRACESVVAFPPFEKNLADYSHMQICISGYVDLINQRLQEELTNPDKIELAVSPKDHLIPS